ncbi:MAG: hypothetical protein FIA95_15805, partial [Gemmatimonadetes bacterium]|nr:hypothetical protein [Gemmatimonadota bacterium]
MTAEATYRALLLRAAEGFPPYPEGRYQGRGIVLAAGGPALLANAFVCLRFLREVTGLPVELFHAGAEEMPARVRALLEADFAPLAVRDITEGEAAFPVSSFRGFQIKPFAVLRSSFEEVLWLDADNLPLRSPEPLFTCAVYAQVKRGAGD